MVCSIPIAATPRNIVDLAGWSNGILSVTAQDKATGTRNHIVITSTNARNSKADVDRMVRDGERFAKEDAALQAKAEARRELDDLIFDLTDEDSEAPDRKIREAEAAEEWVRDAFERCSVDDIKRKISALRAA